MKYIDWSCEKGHADEPTLDRFVESLGGVKISTLHPQAVFENADYLFAADKVLIELKILETEFGETESFRAKLDELNQRIVTTWGQSPLSLDPRVAADYLRGFIDLFKPILARIAKKANRQLRETKKHLGLDDHHGVLLCVNDNFRELPPPYILQAFGRILNGAYSSIDAMIYLTNHYVAVPGSDYAHFLWAPQYSETAPETLVDFVNTLGRKWFDFCEREHGPFDTKQETDQLPGLADIKAIGSKFPL